ncbi:response regulator [Gracilibacillus marinus]|uniref:Response regulator n=1 Tax=Gracilibacillus marinus TaxID=630535 RepID=A0ABV8VYT2_9BACI
MYKILIVEDEELFANALTTYINHQPDMRVVATANDGLDALKKMNLHTFDVVITDIQMPRLNGIELIRRAKQIHPNLKALILTTFNEQNYIVEGLAHGANGYLLKDNDLEEIMKALRHTIDGQTTLPSVIAKQLSSYLLESQSKRIQSELPDWIDRDITEREREILICLKNRLSTKEMAGELCLSEGTIKNYLTLIYQKLGVKKRMEAIELLNKAHDHHPLQ